MLHGCVDGGRAGVNAIGIISAYGRGGGGGGGGIRLIGFPVIYELIFHVYYSYIREEKYGDVVYSC